MEEGEDTAADSVLKQVEELRHENAVLQTENEMFRIFLSQVDSLSLASPAQMEAEHRGKSEGSRTPLGLPNFLKLEQKCYIAVSELEEVKQELEVLGPMLERNAKNYKANIEDSGTRLVEIKKEQQDFEQFVARTLQTTPFQSQRAQKIIGYIERKIKAKEVLMERLHRRNRFLATQIVKQQQKLQHTEQMQEKLCKIDLEHLKQKNMQCREILQKFQEQLLCQRVLVRKSQQGLNSYKEQLKKETQESASLTKNVTSHEEKLAKIREQQQKVERERAQAEALNKKLRARMSNFRVPEVMKYVESKISHDRLKRSVNTLERKARLAEMSSSSQKNMPGVSSGCSTNEDH